MHNNTLSVPCSLVAGKLLGTKLVSFKIAKGRERIKQLSKMTNKRPKSTCRTVPKSYFPMHRHKDLTTRNGWDQYIGII